MGLEVVARAPLLCERKKLGRGRNGKKEVLVSLREGMKFGSISLSFIPVPSFHPIMPIWRYICFSFLEEVTLARFSDSLARVFFWLGNFAKNPKVNLMFFEK